MRAQEAHGEIIDMHGRPGKASTGHFLMRPQALDAFFAVASSLFSCSLKVYLFQRIIFAMHDSDTAPGTTALLSPQPPAQPLTDADYFNACLSYRHDFGLMSDEDRQKLVFQAKEWARAFGITKGGAA